MAEIDILSDEEDELLCPAAPAAEAAAPFPPPAPPAAGSDEAELLIDDEDELLCTEAPAAPAEATPPADEAELLVDEDDELPMAMAAAVPSALPEEPPAAPKPKEELVALWSESEDEKHPVSAPVASAGKAPVDEVPPAAPARSTAPVQAAPAMAEVLDESDDEILTAPAGRPAEAAPAAPAPKPEAPAQAKAPQAAPVAPAKPEKEQAKAPPAAPVAHAKPEAAQAKAPQAKPVAPAKPEVAQAKAPQAAPVAPAKPEKEQAKAPPAAPVAPTKPEKEQAKARQAAPVAPAKPEKEQAKAAPAVPAVPAKAPPAAPDSDDEDEMLCVPKAAAPPAPPARPPATPQSATAGPVASGDAVKAVTEKVKAKEKAKAKSAPAPAPATATAPAPAEKEAAKVVAQPKAEAKAKAKSEAKAAPVKKLSKEEMEAKILDYMRQQNRPYNSQNVFDNLHGAVPKASVQAIMDSLVTEGKLLLKEYGKIKVFLVSQSSVGGSEEAGQLQQQVDEVSKKRKELHGSLEVLRKEMAQVAAKHSAAKEAQESQEEVIRLQEQAEKWRAAGDGDRVDESEVLAVEKEFAEVHRAWRKRKRLCMETLSTLSEGMGMRTSQLVENYGVDTDEDCNQLMPPEFMQS